MSDREDVEIAVKLAGLDFEARCAEPHSAAHPATYAIKCRECKVIPAFVCREHLVEVISVLSWQTMQVLLEGNRPAVGCNSCKASAPTFMDLFEVIGIKP